jgi:hypothetical protein
MMATPQVHESQLVSQELATELKKKVREAGLLMWVDSDGKYSGFVDRLASELDFPYPVVSRNSRRSSRCLSVVEIEQSTEP